MGGREREREREKEGRRGGVIHTNGQSQYATWHSNAIFVLFTGLEVSNQLPGVCVCVCVCV